MTQLDSGAKVQPGEYFTHTCYIIDDKIDNIFVSIDSIHCKSLKNQYKFFISYDHITYPILLLSHEEVDLWILEHL